MWKSYTRNTKPISRQKEKAYNWIKKRFTHSIKRKYKIFWFEFVNGYLYISREFRLIFKECRHPVKPWFPANPFMSPTGACGVPPKCSHEFRIIWPVIPYGITLIQVGWSPDIASVSLTRSEALQWVLLRLKSSLYKLIYKMYVTLNQEFLRVKSKAVARIYFCGRRGVHLEVI